MFLCHMYGIKTEKKKVGFKPDTSLRCRMTRGMSSIGHGGTSTFFRQSAKFPTKSNFSIKSHQLGIPAHFPHKIYTNAFVLQSGNFSYLRIPAHFSNTYNSSKNHIKICHQTNVTLSKSTSDEFA